MGKIVISVIVPVYKAEQFLFRCIDSILNQTFTDYELILVDDGSPDNCGTICDQYAAKDSRIKVIHKPNGGASSARNAGIEVAQGEYIMFCDSDDVVSPMWAARLLQYADGKTLPVGYYCHDLTQLGMEKQLIIPEKQRFASCRYDDFIKAGVGGYLCNSMFAKRIIKDNGLRFRERCEEGDYNEDLLFSLQYVRHVEKIVYTGYMDYLYDSRDGSLSRSYIQYYFSKYQEKFWLRHDFLIDVNGDLENFAHLAETSMYHFLIAMQYAFSDGNYRKFREIVQSEAVTRCLALSDCPRENPRVIALLKNRASVQLWLLFTISSLKGRKQK